MYESLAAQLETDSEDPRVKDLRVRAFSRALLGLLSDSSSDLLLSGLKNRSESEPPSSEARLVLRALQKHLMFRDPRYPEHYSTPTAWLDAFERLSEDRQALTEFTADLSGRQLQSNVVERYKALKLVIQLLKPHIGPAPNVLDVGCSRNHGLGKLMLELPFRQIDCGISDSYYPSATLNASFNSLINLPLRLSSSTGTDIVPITYGQDAVWARSCSFSPSELLNQDLVCEYDYLDRGTAPGLRFKVSDFSENGLDQESDYDRYSVVTASTFLYQLPPEKREQARSLFRKYLLDDGIIIYQDFASYDNDSHLEIKNDWTEPYAYRTLVEFSREPSRLYEVLNWDSGRCDTWKPGKDIESVLLKQ